MQNYPHAKKYGSLLVFKFDATVKVPDKLDLLLEKANRGMDVLANGIARSAP